MTFSLADEEESNDGMSILSGLGDTGALNLPVSKASKRKVGFVTCEHALIWGFISFYALAYLGSLTFAGKQRGKAGQIWRSSQRVHIYCRLSGSFEFAERSNRRWSSNYLSFFVLITLVLWSFSDVFATPTAPAPKKIIKDKNKMGIVKVMRSNYDIG